MPRTTRALFEARAGGADLDYSREISIDRDRLDLEWARQPELFLRWAEEAARARADADRAKERLGVVRAEADFDAREAMASEGRKVTETQVAVAVVLDDRVRAAEAQNIEAWERYGLLSAAREAFAQRKDSLEALVRLHGQNYYSTPRALDEDARAAKDAISREASRRRSKEVTRRKER